MDDVSTVYNHGFTVDIRNGHLIDACSHVLGYSRHRKLSARPDCIPNTSRVPSARDQGAVQEERAALPGRSGRDLPEGGRR